MSQFNTLQLKDYTATEVDFTVGTINTQNGVATWYGPPLMGSSFDQRANVTFSLSLPSAKSNRARLKLKLTRPVLDSMTSKKLDEDIVNIDFSLSRISSLSNRQEVLAYVADLLQDTVVQKAVHSFEGVY